MICSQKAEKKKFDGFGWMALHTTNSTSTLLGLNVPACVSRKNDEARAVVTTNHRHHNSFTVGSSLVASDAFYGHPIKVGCVPHGRPAIPALSSRSPSLSPWKQLSWLVLGCQIICIVLPHSQYCCCCYTHLDLVWPDVTDPWLFVCDTDKTTDNVSRALWAATCFT